MKHRSLVVLHVLPVLIAAAWAAPALAQAPASSAGSRRSGQNVEDAADAGRPAGSPGVLDELHVHALGTARKRHQGVLYKRGSR